MDVSFDHVIDRRDTNSLKWTRYGRDILPLWVADMDFPAPEPARQCLQTLVDHGIFGYEMPTLQLRQTIADRMDRLYHWQVSPEMVLATPGVVAGFTAAARAMCRQGEGVLVQPPVYHPFLEVPALTGTVLQTAPLNPVHDRHVLRYSLDWPAFEAAFNSNGARTGMFLLCHPHNPTGQIYARPDLERMAEICLRNDTVICSDEIHSELLLGPARHLPMAALDPEIARRTITLVSASKTFNLVGLFCGFAIIPDETLRARYRHVLEASALHVNSFGLRVAQTALGGACDSWLHALRAYLTANRDAIADLVAREMPGVRVTLPDATYLAWLDFTAPLTLARLPPDPYRFFLERAKVALNPGAQFGQGGEACLRLNFGCPRSTLLQALGRMRDALKA